MDIKQLGPAGHTGLDLRHTSDALEEADEPGFQSSVDRMTTVYHLPGETESYQIRKRNPNISAVLFRMKLSAAGRMPQIATKIVDQQAIELLTRWIMSLTR